MTKRSTRPPDSTTMSVVSRWRWLGFYAITWGLILTASVFAAEIALRLTGRVTVQGVGTARAGVFEHIPGVFEPGQRVVERPRAELEHRISINSLGYRGAEIDAKNPGGRVRILCLGDSFTYGSYVDDDKTLPASLEGALRRAGHPVDVINGGVGGTTIVDQLYLLRKSAGVDFDIVLLVFSENDITDLVKEEPMYMALERNRKLKSMWGLSHLYSLTRHTALFNFALGVRGWLNARRWAGDNPVGGERNSDRLEALWNRYDILLRQMQSELAERRTRFAFVIFPSHFRIDRSGDDRLIDRIEQIAKRREIRTVNLLEPLRASGLGASALYLLPWDGHPSSRGYAVAGDAIAEALEIDVRGAAMMRAPATTVRR